MGIVRCEEEGQPISIGRLLDLVNQWQRKNGYGEICEVFGGVVPQVNGFRIRDMTHNYFVSMVLVNWMTWVFRVGSLI